VDANESTGCIGPVEIPLSIHDSVQKTADTLRRSLTLGRIVQRTAAAPRPSTAAVTSARDVMALSPGVVMASAPWATP
jgi:hypothetical protein